MIKRKKQKIISKFGPRVRDGKREFHRGVDLRSWNMVIWKRQPAIFPERCQVLRKWRDRWGGGIVYEGLETGYVFKSIHIKIDKFIVKGGVYEPGEIIGYSEKVPGIKEHEHFEVLIKDTIGYDKKYLAAHIDEFWKDPKIYFQIKGIKY